MKYLITVLLLVFFYGCAPKIVDMFPVNEESYAEELKDWQIQRNKEIKSPKGWLSVVGLTWLQEGRNVLGSDPSSDVIFPDGAAKRIGDVYLEKGELYFKAFGESYVSKNNVGFREGAILSDAHRVPTELSHKSYYFHVIRRGNKFGLRIKNTLAEERYKFEGIENYPVNMTMRITAEARASETKDSILIQDIVGIETNYKVQSILSFKHKRKSYDLIAFDGGKDEYFVIFSDLTNSKTTYGGGRFISVNKPESNSKFTVIDFNRAYNPPCAFTSFATCPIPPSENYLDFEVLAGEKTISK